VPTWAIRAVEMKPPVDAMPMASRLIVQGVSAHKASLVEAEAWLAISNETERKETTLVARGGDHPLLLTCVCHRPFQRSPAFIPRGISFRGLKQGVDVSPAAPAASAMNSQNVAQPTIQDDGLGRVLGACAVVGVGLVCASLVPAASPVILGRCAFEAGRIIGRR
jgi:hypothetical protein